MDLINSIKKAFSSTKKDPIPTEVNPSMHGFDKIIADAEAELQTKGGNYWAIKASEYKAFRAVIDLSEKEKVEFILYAVRAISRYFAGRTTFNPTDNGHNASYIQGAFYQHLLKTKLTWDADDACRVAEIFRDKQRYPWTNITGWPLVLFVNQIEKNFKESGLPDQVKTLLFELKNELDKHKAHAGKDLIKVINKVDTLIFESQHGKDTVKPVSFLGEDPFSNYANNSISGLPEEEKRHWYALMALAQKASGGKPTTKYLDQSRTLFKELGSEKFKIRVNDWFDFIVRMKETSQQHTHAYAGRTYNFTTYDFLAAPNIDALKGFVWMCAHFHDTRTLQHLAALAERSFKKIPGRGPAAAAIGNACLFTLFKSKGLEGIGHLSRLKLRIKQSSTQAMIDRYLEEAAQQQGVTVSEIEDLAVDDFGLVDGKREFEIEGYRFVVQIKDIGDVALVCYKPDGSTQKSIPSVVMEKASDRIKKIKELVKKVEIATGAQRDRVDRMLRMERSMTWEYFNQHYFSHGLMSFLTKGIIWRFETGSECVEVIHRNEAWTKSDGRNFSPNHTTKVSFWHPVMSTLDNVKAWREFLLKYEIKQPIKQAFREVYILTDAEINTKTYSNRMAAHVIRQHQFNSLAKTRGWKYSLLGAYDDGRANEVAQLSLSEYGMRAEFWVNEVNADGAFNDTGIWNYVATDQVRFIKTETGEPVNLVDVPKIPFAEVMRDVDLFVGVASVGNDPTWRDNGGMPAYRDYWQSYSFGELSEIAKNRKETLARLLPRLKIASVASIKDKFLVIKGTLRTYKIHIGSSNILMEPNDQYLCIVPDRSLKTGTENVFLPFEGDTGLSLVLSKAFLLAADNKIVDSTIMSQINRAQQV